MLPFISPIKTMMITNYILGGAHGVMVIMVGNGHGDSSSNLDETDCISHSTNTLGERYESNYSPSSYG